MSLGRWISPANDRPLTPRLPWARGRGAPRTKRSHSAPIKRVARLSNLDWDGVVETATTHPCEAGNEGPNSKIRWSNPPRRHIGFRAQRGGIEAPSSTPTHSSN